MFAKSISETSFDLLYNKKTPTFSRIMEELDFREITCIQVERGSLCPKIVLKIPSLYHKVAPKGFSKIALPAFMHVLRSLFSFIHHL